MAHAAFKQLLEAEHLICRFLASDPLGTARATLALLLGFGRPAPAVLTEKRLELSLLARRHLARRIDTMLGVYTDDAVYMTYYAPVKPQTRYQKSLNSQAQDLANSLRGWLGFPQLSLEEMYVLGRERAAMKYSDLRGP